MEREQELEWKAAQEIEIGLDLAVAAKWQLQFLAAVDRNRWLCEGSALQKAIYRYNACWLPLLARHSESPILEGPLVVPLDCEWIWHCHRLNPVRYKSDCEELYGRILDKHNVVSSVQESSIRETEEIWNRLYPNEPYNFDLTSALSDEVSENVSGSERFTKYDLVSAVKRQGPFFYQVSRPHMNNDLFLEGAVARYRGFLHLIKRNWERSVKCFCVPTYDIDLIWHSHQLHPAHYCKDLVKALGKVLEHDDIDSDRSKGKKLDVGFSMTTKQWEETFGSRYWRAGAMYKGNAPSPLTSSSFPSDVVTKNVVMSNDHQKIMPLSEMKIVEVMLEFVDVRNLPERHKGSLFVWFSKTQPDTIFSARRRLPILSEYGEKQVASFHCQPTGHLLFELVSHSASNFPISKPAKTMGSISLSLEELLCPVANLSAEKWLELVPSSGAVNSKPICLRVAISFTIPMPAPHVLQMVHSRPFSKSSCFFPLTGRVQFAKSWTHVIDEAGNEVISLQMRDIKKTKGRTDYPKKKEVIGITKCGQICTLAEFMGTQWSLVETYCPFQFRRATNKDGYLYELIGHQIVKIFPGRKLEYEPKNCEKQRSECDFMTAVEFSAEEPYGKAVALLDLKLGIFKVKEEWFALPGMTLAFIFSETLRKEGYNGLTLIGNNSTKKDSLINEVNGCNEEGKRTNLTSAEAQELKSSVEVAKASTMTPEKECCGGCGRCENLVRTESCGGCAGCGNSAKSSGCDGGCGNMVKNGSCGGCGSGCGACGGGCAGCGNPAKSSGCGGCGSCGGGCGNMVKNGSCGGCGSGCGACGGGCGNTLANANAAGKACTN